MSSLSQLKHYVIFPIPFKTLIQRSHFTSLWICIICLGLPLHSIQAANWKVVNTSTVTPQAQNIVISKNGQIMAASNPSEPCPADPKKTCSAVYIYANKLGKWRSQAKLFTSESIKTKETSNIYVSSLNYDGSVLAASGQPKDRGAIYLFTRKDNIWTEQQKIVLPKELLPTPQLKNPNPDWGTFDTFGSAIAFSNDGNVLATATQFESIKSDTGAVYVYQKIGNTWKPQKRLVGSKVDPKDNETDNRYSTFGESIDISGDGKTLLISSTGSNKSFHLYGVYVFNNKNDIWKEENLLTAPDLDYFDGFGYKMTLSSDGNTAIVSGQNGCYVFTTKNSIKSIWHLETKLGRQIGDFGISSRFFDINDSGEFVVIGDLSQAKVFLFTRNTKNNRVVWQPKLLMGSKNTNGFALNIGISGDAKTIWIDDVIPTPPTCGKQTDGTDLNCHRLYTLQTQP